MKEIKFRAFCGKDKMMYLNIQNGIAFEDGSIYDFNELINPPTWDYHEWHIMQFTGLKDKNGKEIYEGDILDRRLVVVWVNGAFMIKNGNNRPTRPNGESWIKFEVIGNIYENEELLNNTI